jgi:spermidine/putrescine transport system ATP-binding protein
MNKAVEAIGVSKSFHSTQALKEVNLNIGEGEFFSLLGPSGCGKTTLLRMIAGFEQPTTGHIKIGGADVTHVPPHKRPVNMVFQSYALFPHLSIFENIAFGLKVKQSCPQAEIADKVNAALELVRLQDYGKRFPSQLSGGQQQRVALARAIVNKPTVLLLDEPLSALDLKIRQEMQEELSRLQKQLGITFIMVTHDQGEALALSDRIAVLYNGNLEQVGSPQEIYECPKTAFVANFIGQTNLIEAIVVEADNRLAKVRISDDMEIVLKVNEEIFQANVGEKVIVWMRTQSLNLSNKPSTESRQSGSTNIFAATITQLSYQGHSLDVWLKLPSAMIIRATLLNGNLHGFAVGQTVSVEIDANSVYMLAYEKLPNTLCALNEQGNLNTPPRTNKKVVSGELLCTI